MRSTHTRAREWADGSPGEGHNLERTLEYPNETSVYKTMTGEVQLLWGHDIRNPEGLKIRLPAMAFPKLRRLGLLVRHPSGLFQISDRIYAFFDPDCDSLTEGLRQILGYNCEGPEWLVCQCRQCRRRHDKLDRDALTFVRTQDAKRTGFRPAPGRQF